MTHSILKVLTFAPALALAVTAFSTQASAQERPDHEYPMAAAYPLEVELHATFGAGDVYGNTGFGAGVRGHGGQPRQREERTVQHPRPD